VGKTSNGYSIPVIIILVCYILLIFKNQLMKKKMNTKTFIYLVSDKDMLSDYNCFFLHCYNHW